MCSRMPTAVAASAMIRALLLLSCAAFATSFSLCPSLGHLVTGADTSPSISTQLQQQSSGFLKLWTSLPARRNQALRLAMATTPKIDSEEIELKLLDTFKALDTDNTGKVSVDGFKKALEDLNYTPEQAEQIFTHMDVDKDGNVSTKDFMDACMESGCSLEETIYGEDSTANLDEILASYFKHLTNKYLYQPSPLFQKEVVQVSTVEEFNQLLQKSEKKPVCVMFATSHCRKCAVMKPKFASTAAKYGDHVGFIQWNTDQIGNKLTKQKAKLIAVPTFQIWQEGKLSEGFLAGPSIPETARTLAAMVEKYLPEGAMEDE